MDPYGYAYNNPVVYTDPTGMAPEKEYPDSYKGQLGCGDWRESDRLNNTQVWKNANMYNTKNNIKNQYEPFSQVLAYYKWVQSESDKIGHEVKWMSGAIGLVGDLTALEKGASFLMRDSTVKLLEDLNIGIQNATLPFFNNLLYGKFANNPLKGDAAKNWDIALVNYEQGVIAPPIYKSAPKSAIAGMNQLAGSNASGFGWHSLIGGGSAPPFSLFGASVTDTQARIDIPLLMLYPDTYKPKGGGFVNMLKSNGTLTHPWIQYFKGKSWKVN